LFGRAYTRGEITMKPSCHRQNSFTVCVPAAHSAFSARLRHEQSHLRKRFVACVCVCMCVCVSFLLFFPREIESNPRNRIARANYGEYREECARLEFPLCGTPEFLRNSSLLRTSLFAPMSFSHESDWGHN